MLELDKLPSGFRHFTRDYLPSLAVLIQSITYNGDYSNNSRTSYCMSQNIQLDEPQKLHGEEIVQMYLEGWCVCVVCVCMCMCKMS